VNLTGSLEATAYGNAGWMDALKSYVATIANGRMLAGLHAAFPRSATWTTEGVMSLLLEGRL